MSCTDLSFFFLSFLFYLSELGGLQFGAAPPRGRRVGGACRRGCRPSRRRDAAPSGPSGQNRRSVLEWSRQPCAQVGLVIGSDVPVDTRCPTRSQRSQSSEDLYFRKHLGILRSTQQLTSGPKHLNAWVGAYASACSRE